MSQGARLMGNSVQFIDNPSDQSSEEEDGSDEQGSDGEEEEEAAVGSGDDDLDEMLETKGLMFGD